MEGKIGKESNLAVWNHQAGGKVGVKLCILSKGEEVMALVVMEVCQLH